MQGITGSSAALKTMETAKGSKLRFADAEEEQHQRDELIIMSLYSSYYSFN